MSATQKQIARNLDKEKVRVPIELTREDTLLTERWFKRWLGSSF